MKASTVRIDVRLVIRGRIVPLGLGSGFVLDPRHVATNAHVAVDDEAVIKQMADTAAASGLAAALRSGEAVLQYLIRVPGDSTEAKLVERQADKDLAVLELQETLGSPVSTYAGEELVEVGDPVIAMGFPGAAENLAEDMADPSMAKGEVSRNRVRDSNLRLYQVDVSINPGNSGGPLFNTCGEIVGINTFKSYAKVRDEQGKIRDVTAGEGIAWSIRADELLAVLDKLQLPYTRANEACVPNVARDPAVYFALALAGVSLLVGFTRRGRAAVREAVTSITRRPPRTSPIHDQTRPPLSPAAKPRPVLRGLDGPYRNNVLELDQEPVTIGRDPKVSQVVFPPDTPDVSKNHCTLRYSSSQVGFTLTDSGSTSGTFLDSGERLESATPRLLRSGDRFYLGDPRNLFEVRLEGSE